MDQVMIGDIVKIENGVGVVLNEKMDSPSAYFIPTSEHCVGQKVQYVVEDTSAGPEAKRILVLLQPKG